MRFVVKAKEFRHGGRVLAVGEEFDSEDTTEIRTLKALGQIADAQEEGWAQRTKRGLETRQLKAEKAEPPEQQPEQAPGKRTYRRRDQVAEE
jgi:hypothetical protein